MIIIFDLYVEFVFSFCMVPFSPDDADGRMINCERRSNACAFETPVSSASQHCPSQSQSNIRIFESDRPNIHIAG